MVRDNDELMELFFETFRIDGLPKIMDSAMMVVMQNGEPDPKQCLEVGAAIMLDKPLLILRWPDQKVPEHLRRAADKIIDVEPGGMSENVATMIKEFADEYVTEV